MNDLQSYFSNQSKIEQLEKDNKNLSKSFNEADQLKADNKALKEENRKLKQRNTQWRYKYRKLSALTAPEKQQTRTDIAKKLVIIAKASNPKSTKQAKWKIADEVNLGFNTISELWNRKDINKKNRY
tara:strand:+ start:198 stop:578 length:381 start_codon:yes stop_codon:yes gene_type:complete